MTMRLVNANATPFQNESTGASTATMVLPRIPRYLDQIDLVGYIDGVRMTQAEVLANVQDIEIVMFGNNQRPIKPSRHVKLEALKGQAFRAGRVPIRFTQPERRTPGGETRTAAVMDELGPITIKINQLNNAAATTRTWEARLVTRPFIRDGNERMQGPLVTYSEKQVEVTAAGLKTDTYQPPAGRAISMMHFLTDQITALKIYLGELVIGDFKDKQTLDDLLIDNGYTPQADIWSFGGELLSSQFEDFLITGDKVLKFEFTMASAANFEALFEEMGDPKI